LIPNFRITSGGKDLTNAIRTRLLKLTIRDEKKLKSDSMSIELADDPPIELPADNQVFEVAIGYKDVLVNVGSFATKHIAVSGPPRILKIEASAMNQAASLKTRREQSWESTTLGDLVAAIARRNGLAPAVIPDLKAIPITHESQTESDAAFLQRLGRRYDFLLKVSSRRLIVTPHDKSLMASGGDLPKIEVSNPIRYEFSGDQAKKYTGVRAYWYDSQAAAKRYVFFGRQGVVLELEFNQVSEAQARKVAEAKFREVSRKSKTLKFTVPGNLDLAAERKVLVSGIRTGVDGEWIIKSVEHTIDGSGFLSSVDCSESGYREDFPDDNGTPESPDSSL
jgi:phage protein D